MNVFHFGTGARRLFGVYLPGAVEGPSARVAVLCSPWGQEYLRSHRSVRQLGLLLNTAGFHVLRFDYYGTGDSAGDMVDATVRDWEEDVMQAIDEAKDTAGVDRVCLIGLRLGGSLAAEVAARRPEDIKDLVLWDPVISGRDYVAALRGIARANIHSAPEQATLQVNGFPLTPVMASELTAIDLVALTDRLPRRTLTVISGDARAAEDSAKAFRQALAARNGGTAVDVIDAPPAWIEHRGSGTALMPVAVLQRITQWLS